MRNRNESGSQYKVSFLKQGLGLKASAVKRYLNFPFVHPSGMMFFLRLVSLSTGVQCPVVPPLE